MIDGIKIVGGKGERRALDFYPTPPECTKALLKYLNLKPGAMDSEVSAPVQLLFRRVESA